MWQPVIGELRNKRFSRSSKGSTAPLFGVVDTDVAAAATAADKVKHK